MKLVKDFGVSIAANPAPVAPLPVDSTLAAAGKRQRRASLPCKNPSSLPEKAEAPKSGAQTGNKAAHKNLESALAAGARARFQVLNVE